MSKLLTAGFIYLGSLGGAVLTVAGIAGAQALQRARQTIQDARKEVDAARRRIDAEKNYQRGMR